MFQRKCCGTWQPLVACQQNAAAGRTAETQALQRASWHAAAAERRTRSVAAQTQDAAAWQWQPVSGGTAAQPTATRRPWGWQRRRCAQGGRTAAPVIWRAVANAQQPTNPKTAQMRQRERSTQVEPGPVQQNRRRRRQVTVAAGGINVKEGVARSSAFVQQTAPPRMPAQARRHARGGKALAGERATALHREALQPAAASAAAPAPNPTLPELSRTRRQQERSPEGVE